MVDLLRIDGLTAGYGAARIIDDLSLSLTLAPAQVLAVLGRNGAGKTTMLSSIIGVTDRFAGRLWLNGADITAHPPERRARAGIGWVPQERNVFRSLSVAENLTATARPGPWTRARVEQLFPRLSERASQRAGQLSGGEQQMLAIGRALMLNPRLLLLDEPTEGLAPVIVAEMMAALTAIAAKGMAMVIVEQHAAKALAIADRAVILDRGRVVHHADAGTLLADPATLAAHLGAG